MGELPLEPIIQIFCVFLKTFLPPSFSDKNGLLNSNYYTKNAYGDCNQLVFRI
jgi:hypothetical protein